MAKKINIDRRHFIGGAGILAASASVMGMLAGCSPESSSSSDETEATTDVPQADEEKDCDILIIGAGASGLAACVEAAESGKNVICIESQSAAGGNAQGVEGCFGVDSSMQKEEGIEVDTGALIRQELEAGQYRVNALDYTDMIANSGANIDWLLDHGVEFGGVDADMGTLKLFHRFATGNGSESYVPHMVDAAQSAGAEIMYDTHGDSLIVGDDGAVIGAYATQNDSTIKINAKAVIIATGGYMENPDYMKRIGYDQENLVYMGFEGHDGSGHAMAMDAGAADNISNGAPQGSFAVEGLPSKFAGGKFTFFIGATAPYAVWINENGERFVNEDCASTNIMLMTRPGLGNKTTHIIFDQALMDQYTAGDEEAEKELADGIEEGSILKADSLEELASAAEWDAGTFAATMDRYNESCKGGSDRDFGKVADAMVEFGDGPFYAVRVKNELLVVVGSIKTNRDFNAVDDDGNAIKGLYAVGVEGSMLWANIYTINVSGSCNANSINSARTAVQHAIANCL